MKNQKINHVLFWIIVFTLTFVLNSCGARKAEKTRSTEETKNETTTAAILEKKEESAVKVEEKTTVIEKDNSKVVETSYRPIDPTKEATITTPEGKKHTLHNAEVVIKETTQDKERKTDTSIDSETTNKSELKEESESNNKAAAKKASEVIVIDKKAWSPVHLLWLLIPVLIVVFLFNKYKSKIWWV
ncbi:hypothetical protein H8R23_04950 [Flavobacterium sp. F-380]|uniref:Lipoprotein n=1 Tax=Flavobacterium kayseriense TaxID=2764714 RepID=A0ABR7J5F6_9FLAO|nr:hypothetical protein [Flavobacterium kayseriense]MBC5840745.1 hypothetical protein [Flavobacterium kayseriense]MBC5846585.1 hypothetical protein [Flavobacterium kayseriense]